MTPDPNTANLFDILIKQADNIRCATDISLSVAEFAVGFPTQNRDFDVCFGFNLKSSADTENINKDIVIGQGVYRLNGDEDFLNFQDSETLFDVKTLMTTLPPISDTYLFGVVYLRCVKATGNLSFGFELTKPNGVVPLSMLRDISESDIVNWVKNNTVDITLAVEAGISKTELYKFVVSIDNYTGVTNSKIDRLKVIVVDQRKPRGWAGFAQEDMSLMIPYVLRYKDNIGSLTIDAELKIVINSWLDLNWARSFVDFWNNAYPTYVLPQTLYNYIISNFEGYDDLKSIDELRS